MKILSVAIQNILSIESALIEFDDAGLVLVQGWNHDDGRANGAGKTAIFNAIAFALYDRMPRKITATEILRRGTKSGYVEVTVSLNDDVYVVRRSRPKGVIFSRSGNALTMTQAEWESKLCLNYEQFSMSMYCAQNTSERFLSVKDSDKKQFFLQLLNLEGFSACKTVADKKIDALEGTLLSIQSKIDVADSKIDAYSESLVDENVILHHMGLIDKDVASLSKEIIELQSVAKPDISKYQSLEDNMNLKRTEIAGAKVRREMLHDDYRKISSKIRPLSIESTCRLCGSSLDVMSAQKTHHDEMTMLHAELASLKAQIDECDLVASKELQVNDLSIKLRERKREESREYDAALASIAERQKHIALKHKESDNLNLKLKNNSELLSKIEVLVKLRAKLLDDRVRITRDIEIYKTVSAMYSSTGAQAYILDSIIDSFNEYVKNYVTILWSNLTYELQSYKETVKGDVTAKFSESMMMDGKLISMGSLSGGEFRALSLCVDFALIDVMENQFGIKMSTIVLDEPFDGLDSAGRELIFELLENMSKNRTVVVVDHSSELKSMFSKVITVEKRDGISTVSLSS
jgi:DNA repair exonuclease SbcCD ATPase subunit